MNTPIPKELQIALLVSSIRAPELFAVTAAVKTLADEAMTWEKVCARLIEEQQALHTNQPRHERVAATQRKCEICNRRGHTTESCWLNPKNPNNRLGSGSNRTKENITPTVDRGHKDAKPWLRQHKHTKNTKGEVENVWLWRNHFLERLKHIRM